MSVSLKYSGNIKRTTIPWRLDFVVLPVCSVRKGGKYFKMREAIHITRKNLQVLTEIQSEVCELSVLRTRLAQVLCGFGMQQAYKCNTIMILSIERLEPSKRIVSQYNEFLLGYYPGKW